MSATNNAASDSTPCHLCGGAALAVVAGYEKLWRVSSDCKAVRPGGRLCVCMKCGGVQKAIDAGWQREIDAIYKGYDIYHQSGGVEQAVFGPAGGGGTPRSRKLVEKVCGIFPVAERGRLLDVGCGNGALLRAFAEVRPGWRLVGTELDDKYRAVIEKIPGVERLHVGPPESAPGKFELVSMIHVLEHIPSPRKFLESLHGKLADAGGLLVEVPNHRANPFDLLIADHSTHFSIPVLGGVLEEAGFEPVTISDEVVAKELTAAARRAGGKSGKKAANPPADALAGARARVDWLTATAEWAREAAKPAGKIPGAGVPGGVGIFGTSIGATFLSAEIGGVESFYVDEDPARAGRTHGGKPIYRPAETPAGSRVLAPLPPRIAEAVAERLGGRGVEYLTPPGMK